MWWLALAAVAFVGRPAGSRELDPAACAARFDVQRDKIIRTEESRDMGARYLSELDVGARHECLRLCCETDSCDVFVYEEKSPGSCYLFNCGPPEDFRCKFTAHGNFSSGVLALSRRLAELQDQERLAQHRPPPPPPHPAAPATPPPVPTPAKHPAPPPTPAFVEPRTTTTARPADPAPALAQPPPPAPPSIQQQPSRRCSRYQFECRLGGECIAVYNACDGIPQCADGSDEAPELACPAPPPPPSPPRPSSTPATLPPPMPPQDNYLPEAVEPSSEVRWPHRLTLAQPPRRYSEAGVGISSNAGAAPHIFSHQGGLLQVQPPAYAQPPNWPRRGWAPPPPPPPQTGGEWNAWRNEGPDWRDGGDRGWQRPPPPPPPEPEPEPAAAEVAAPVARTEEVAPAAARGRPHDAPKKGPPPPPPAPPSPQPTTPKAPAKHDEPAKEVHLVAAAAHGSDDHEGRSERPPAALLLLILGVLMTGALGVLVGVRARAGRRRRRGRALAHDADYLVNGMYL